MSLLVFPSTVTSLMKFPIKQSPMFRTITQTPASGRGELRIPLMQFPRWDFQLDFEYIPGDNQGTNTVWQTLLNFYMSNLGAAEDWLFLHPWDNTVPNTSPQTIATTDGTTTVFGIYRTLVASGAQDLIQNFVSAPVIYLNGSPISSSLYTIDQYGDITFTVAPTTGQTLAWSGVFYYRCHFLEDTWSDLQEDYYQIWSLSGMRFRSVLL